MNRNYFNIANWIFWILIILLLVIMLTKSDLRMFKQNKFVYNERSKYLSEKRRIEREKENLENEENERRSDDGKDKSKKHRDKNKTSNDEENKGEEWIDRTWTWESFDGKAYTMNFKVAKSAYLNAAKARKSAPPNPDCWAIMFRNDREGLENMIEAYKDIIVEHQLDYLGVLEMVVSSAQNFDYTYITWSKEPCRNISDRGNKPVLECKPIGWPHGCCDNVDPYAVYSPLEYAVNGCGDCDTKSLFAMSILRYLDMGIDAQMLMGYVEAGPHAMLGICTPNPPLRDRVVVDRLTGKRYYAWECTARRNEFKLGARVWQQFRDWKVKKIN